MKPFELRLAEQHARNAKHLKNLNILVQNASRFSRISLEEQSLLLEQMHHMTKLNEVLEVRMRLHNIPV